MRMTTARGGRGGLVCDGAAVEARCVFPAGLEFIDSTGLRVIVRAVEASRRDRWELRLRQGPPAVRRVFEIAGVLGALPFEAP